MPAEISSVVKCAASRITPRPCATSRSTCSSPSNCTSDRILSRGAHQISAVSQTVMPTLRQCARRIRSRSAVGKLRQAEREVAARDATLWQRQATGERAERAADLQQRRVGERREAAQQAQAEPGRPVLRQQEAWAGRLTAASSRATPGSPGHWPVAARAAARSRPIGGERLGDVAAAEQVGVVQQVVEVVEIAARGVARRQRPGLEVGGAERAPKPPKARSSRGRSRDPHDGGRVESVGLAAATIDHPVAGQRSPCTSEAAGRWPASSTPTCPSSASPCSSSASRAAPCCSALAREAASSSCTRSRRSRKNFARVVAPAVALRARADEVVLRPAEGPAP